MSDSEATVQSKIRLAVAKFATLFRNNVGSYKTPHGYVKYGVCNPGGSDLIGWRSVTITQEMVGQKIAQFVAIECKSSSGKVSDDQTRFIEAVKKAGGVAGVARSDYDSLALLGVSIERTRT